MSSSPAHDAPSDSELDRIRAMLAELDTLPTEEAEELLNTTIYPQLFVIVMRLAEQKKARGPDADDLAQNTMVHVLQKTRENLASIEQLVPWLRSVLRCRDIDQYRWLMRRPGFHQPDARPADQLELADESEVSKPGDVVETQEVAQFVREAVDELREIHRNVVIYHYFEDRPLEEIAGLLGISVGTVKSRLDAAREQLRAKLATRFRYIIDPSPQSPRAPRRGLRSRKDPRGRTDLTGRSTSD